MSKAGSPLELDYVAQDTCVSRVAALGPLLVDSEGTAQPEAAITPSGACEASDSHMVGPLA